MLKKINPSQTKAWKKLEGHYEEMKSVHMKNLFAEDQERSSRFSIRCNDIFLDYSKNIITDKTLGLLFDLAEETDLKDAITKMFGGRE